MPTNPIPTRTNRRRRRGTAAATRPTAGTVALSAAATAGRRDREHAHAPLHAVPHATCARRPTHRTSRAPSRTRAQPKREPIFYRSNRVVIRERNGITANVLRASLHGELQAVVRVGFVWNDVIPRVRHRCGATAELPIAIA